MPKQPTKPDSKHYAVNREARHNYDIIATFVAGIALTGSETKSIRNGKANLRESYAKLDRKGELWLLNTHVSAYQPNPKRPVGEPTRRRKLLLHEDELLKIRMQLKTKGLTLVPLKLFDLHNRIKLELGLARGKKLYNKKEDLKKQDMERDMRQTQKQYRIKM